MQAEQNCVRVQMWICLAVHVNHEFAERLMFKGITLGVRCIIKYYVLYILSNFLHLRVVLGFFIFCYMFRQQCAILRRVFLMMSFYRVMTSLLLNGLTSIERHQ